MCCVKRVCEVQDRHVQAVWSYRDLVTSLSHQAGPASSSSPPRQPDRPKQEVNINQNFSVSNTADVYRGGSRDTGGQSGQ